MPIDDRELDPKIWPHQRPDYDPNKPDANTDFERAHNGTDTASPPQSQNGELT